VSASRTTALVAGIFFVLTFVTSIPAALLYDSVLGNVDTIVSAGADIRVRWGAFLEVLLVIANVGTAVTLFPIVKRQNEGVALGYVATRTVESILIVVGMVSMLTIVTLQQDLAAGATGADAASLNAVNAALIAIHEWVSLFGPTYCAGIGNGILLGYLLYRSGLVPRRLALLGLIGGPLICAAATAVLFGVVARTSGPAFIASLPEIAWEASLGIYLIVKGFRPAPILTDPAAA
jgi:hypothetical protein